MAQSPRNVDEYTEAVADQLRAAKDRLDMTQQEIADRSGIPRSTVGKIIDGTSPIDLSQLRAVTRALKLSTVDVMRAAEQRLGM